MKRSAYILLLGTCALLYGCPYSSPYKLDETPSIYVEDMLLGNWACFVQKPGSDKPEPVKCILSRKNDTEYNIAFTGYFKELKKFRGLQADSIKGSAFMSTINGKQFMNIDIESRTYIAEMKFENNSLSLLPLSEHFTSKMVMNSQALRVCIEYHYKTRTRPMYDDEFCLKDMVKVN